VSARRSFGGTKLLKRADLAGSKRNCSVAALQVISLTQKLAVELAHQLIKIQDQNGPGPPASFLCPSTKGVMAAHSRNFRRTIWLRCKSVRDWAASSPTLASLGKVGEWVGKVAIFAAIVSYIFEAGDRAKQRHYQAWQIIVAAHSLPGDAGRRSALRDLVADKVDASYIDLSDANLDGTDLRGAQMSRASFLRTTLSGTDFGCRWRWILNSLFIPVLSCEPSQLVGAKFFQNHLVRTIFVDAVLTSAIFGKPEQNPFLAEEIENARFNGANLSKGIFSYVFIVDTDFSKSNLQASAFDHVEFNGNTKFVGADLSQQYFIVPNLPPVENSGAPA
jgi:uncharacterized protein YjbI with pentapeptide repeats